jgi:hypothetical protein
MTRTAEHAEQLVVTKRPSVLVAIAVSPQRRHRRTVRGGPDRAMVLQLMSIRGRRAWRRPQGTIRSLELIPKRGDRVAKLLERFTLVERACLKIGGMADQ